MNLTGGIFAGLKLITAPTAEPLVLADAKNHLRVSSGFTGDDAYISGLISMARQQAEATMHRALLLQTWQLSLKNWPGRDYQNWPSNVPSDYDSYFKYDHIALPFAPLNSVLSVNYLDTSNVVNTMPAGNVPGGYNVDLNFEPGRIVLPFAQIWPTTILLPGAPIQIQYTCGYADLNTLKSQFEGYWATVHAMKMIVGYTYENRIPPSEMRKSSVPSGIEFVIEELLTPYQVFA